MSDTLHAYLNDNRRFLREWKSSITVGEARGKFMIMSNFWGFDDHGLNYKNFNVQDQINITTWSSGVYFVTVSNKERKFVGKIVKE